jgi:hypothetical protein
MGVKMKKLILVAGAIGLSACASKSALIDEGMASCNAQYGFTDDVRMQWGEYEIPDGWEHWLTCKHQVLLSTAQGSPSYPVILERVAYERMLMERFKKQEINRNEMNALIMQKVAQLSQKEADIYAARSKKWSELGQALMEQNKRSTPLPAPNMPTNTRCSTFANTLNCTTW